MSFASNVRAEIARELCREECCARAEIAAALLSPGAISYRFGAKNPYLLSITSAEAASVRHYFQLLKRYFGVIAQIRTLQSSTLGGLTRYQLIIPEENSLQILQTAGIYDESEPFGKRSVPTAEILKFACCKKAFVKSAFMLCGAMANPEIEYHIEIDTQDETLADCILECMDHFEIHGKKSYRNAKYVVYLKKSDDVADLLTLIGASQAVLDVYNVRIKKGVSNRVNRQMNCDSSNINRATETAVRQIEDIQYIDTEIGLDKLPKPLREIADVRLQNESAPLAALGELLDKPIGKSGVNARLRKITEIANKLRSGEEIEL